MVMAATSDDDEAGSVVLATIVEVDAVTVADVDSPDVGAAPSGPAPQPLLINTTADAATAVRIRMRL
jgi:hypothetical protein